MDYEDRYSSPLGEILLTSDGKKLVGLRFTDNCDSGLKCALPVFDQAKRWLDVYFSGHKPRFTPPLRLVGSDFQLTVWKLVEQIPYGETTTYGAIAREIARQRKMPHMSAQAIGGALRCNNISIIVPCHRVVGANGHIGGYAGGVERKIALLKLEGAKAAELHA